jgi:hypothetical protein
MSSDYDTISDLAMIRDVVAPVSISPDGQHIRVPGQPPQLFLNYPGHTVGQIGQVMGPNLLGEVVTVVSIDRVTFEASPPKTRLGVRFGIVPGVSHDN